MMIKNISELFKFSKVGWTGKLEASDLRYCSDQNSEMTKISD